MPRPLPVSFLFLPRARVGVYNRGHPWHRAGADQLWIELGINRLADAGTAANDALAASITAMRTSSLSTSTTHGLGELIAVVRECADAAATAGRLGRPHPPS